MPSNFNTFKYAFLGTLLFAVTVITAYQLLYGIPQKKCEDAHDWWSFRYRHCYTPMKIIDMPGMHRNATAAPTSATTASATPAAATAPAQASTAARHP